MTSPIAACLDRRDRPLPWLFSAAARFEGADRGAMLADPGILARSLSTAADLFDLPAVCTGFDTTLEADAAGASVEPDDGGKQVVEGCFRSVDDLLEFDPGGLTTRGGLPVVLEATDRLTATLDDTSVVGGVTGPRRLAASVLHEDASTDSDDDLAYEAALTAGDVAVELANAYLERGADGIAILEPDGIEGTDRYRDAITPLVNVLDHFDAVGVAVQRSLDPEEIVLGADLGFDAITGRLEEPRAVMDDGPDVDVAVGVGVPADRFLEGPDAIDEFRSDLPPGTLLSSEWEVPPETEPETLHRLMGTR